jgi:hypothetical protein
MDGVADDFAAIEPSGDAMRRRCRCPVLWDDALPKRAPFTASATCRSTSCGK